MKKLIILLVLVSSLTTVAQEIQTKDSMRFYKDLNVKCELMSSDMKTSSLDLKYFIKGMSNFQLCINSSDFTARSLNRYIDLGANVAIIADTTRFSKRELQNLAQNGAEIIVYNKDQKFNSRELKNLQNNGVKIRLDISDPDLSRRDIFKIAQAGHQIRILGNDDRFKKRHFIEMLSTYKNAQVAINIADSIFNRRDIVELKNLGAIVYHLPQK